jgi:hypothetical protein
MDGDPPLVNHSSTTIRAPLSVANYLGTDFETFNISQCAAIQFLNPRHPLLNLVSHGNEVNLLSSHCWGRQPWKTEEIL